MASEPQLEYRGYRATITRHDALGITGYVRLNNGGHIHVSGSDCEEFQLYFRYTVDDIWSEDLENRW
jgi:hypothetical protein